MKHSLALAASIVGLTITLGSHGQATPQSFNQPGNVLIADQFNNRVIELDKDKNIVWQFGNGSTVAGPASVVAPNDAERVGLFTLISGTGAPAGAESAAPDGAPDNRVILVGPGGKIIWQYGQAGVTGAGPDELNAPVCAVYLPDDNILITDQGNQRVIEVNPDKEIVWHYGETGTAGDLPGQLNNPNSAELLANGDILIADESNNRVIEVNRAHDIVWHYGTGTGASPLSQPAFASRLADGDTLIADSGNNRAVEVDAAKHMVWQYVTSLRPGSVAAPNPTRAIRLGSGLTLISDQFNDQVIAVDFFGNIDYEYGEIGESGDTAGLLNAPYDAKVIGDYTGLTPPVTP
jgi:hypothetical protein